MRSTSVIASRSSVVIAQVWNADGEVVMSVRTQPLIAYGVMANFLIAAFGSGIAQANRPVTRNAVLSALNAGA
jgi:hypothetical protein